MNPPSIPNSRRRSSNATTRTTTSKRTTRSIRAPVISSPLLPALSPSDITASKIPAAVAATSSSLSPSAPGSSEAEMKRALQKDDEALRLRLAEQAVDASKGKKKGPSLAFISRGNSEFGRGESGEEDSMFLPKRRGVTTPPHDNEITAALPGLSLNHTNDPSRLSTSALSAATQDGKDSSSESPAKRARVVEPSQIRQRSGSWFAGWSGSFDSDSKGPPKDDGGVAQLKEQTLPQLQQTLILSAAQDDMSLGPTAPTASSTTSLSDDHNSIPRSRSWYGALLPSALSVGSTLVAAQSKTESPPADSEIPPMPVTATLPVSSVTVQSSPLSDINRFPASKPPSSYSSSYWPLGRGSSEVSISSSVVPLPPTPQLLLPASALEAASPAAPLSPTAPPQVAPSRASSWFLRSSPSSASLATNASSLPAAAAAPDDTSSALLPAPQTPVNRIASNAKASSSPVPATKGSKPLVSSSLRTEISLAVPGKGIAEEPAKEEHSDPPTTASSWWNYVPYAGGGSRPVTNVGSMISDDEVMLPPSAVVSEAASDIQSELPLPPKIAQQPSTTSSYLSYVNPLAYYSYSSNRSTTPATATSAASSEAGQPITCIPGSSARDLSVSSSNEVIPHPLNTEEERFSSNSNGPSSSWLGFFARAAADNGPIIPQPQTRKGVEVDADIGETMFIPDHVDEVQPLKTAKGKKSSLLATSPNIPQPPLTTSESIKKQTTSPKLIPGKQMTKSFSPSTSPTSQELSTSSPAKPSTTTSLKIHGPNLVLPTFNDIFSRPPRSTPPSRGGVKKKALKLIGNYVASTVGGDGGRKADDQALEAIESARKRGRELPKVSSVVGQEPCWREVKRVVVIGVHGWFPNAFIRYIAGEPTGTSLNFSAKMQAAVSNYFLFEHGATLDDITSIPLEGEGKVEHRVKKLFKAFLSNPLWVEALRGCDAVFLAAHSQGCPVSVHLLEKLYEGGYLRSASNINAQEHLDLVQGKPPGRVRPPHRVCMLALCGVYQGPLPGLKSSYVVQPYINYFENEAAKELFEFQDTTSAASVSMQSSFSAILDHGARVLLVASLNDQVVPVYSALFQTADHPSLLRALHIDGDVYNSADFVTNLLIFCIQLRNAGLDDHGLVMHISEACAHSLTGIGHSTAYQEDASYSLAVKYLMETTDHKSQPGSLSVADFQATESLANPYNIPWILRGILEDPMVKELFGEELDTLRSGFDEWHPSSAKMKDLRRKLEPLRKKPPRLVPVPGKSNISSTSPKL